MEACTLRYRIQYSIAMKITRLSRQRQQSDEKQNSGRCPNFMNGVVSERR